MHFGELRQREITTAELFLAIQKAFPHVRLVPCEPIAGEDMHLRAYLPMRAEEQFTGQDRIVAIKHSVQEKCDVQTGVIALPESA